MAALTASEASIYGRFGFGVATSEQSIKVDTSARFVVNHTPVGSVEVADPKVLLELAPVIFDRLHRQTPGSIERHEFYRQFASGSISRDGAKTRHRCALHYGPDGDVDGYVSYKFGGWSSTPYTMEVVDLVAATRAAYLELWQYLGAIDLVERVTWDEAPVDDPLTWALQDPRCVDASDARDMLWLRILDVQKALGARRYSADGTLVLAVTGQPRLRRRHLRPEGQRGRGHGDAGSGGRAGPVTGRRGPGLHLSGRRLPRDPEGRRPDHRTRGRGGADSAAHVRRRTFTALPHALLAVRPAGRGAAVQSRVQAGARGAKRPWTL